VRRELLQRIEAQPGVHYQDLVRAMGKGKGAIEHHLRKLREGGLVKSMSAAGYTCFFPAAFDRRLTAAAPALKSPGARKVLAAIQANPGASATDVGVATGLSPAAVNHHLQRLGAAGLVDVLRNGRSLSLQPTALASQVAAAGA
jgi:predicted transcriptional regulator